MKLKNIKEGNQQESGGKKCLVCGNTDTYLLYKNMSGYEAGTYFDIFKCNHCKSHFMDEDKIDYEIYDKIYSNEDKVPGYDRYSRYFKEIRESKDKLKYLCDEEGITLIIKSYLEGLKKKKDEITILEVGCGLGYTTYALNEAGYNCLGIDISENSIKKAKKNFGDYYLVGDANKLGDYEKYKRQYDIVFSTEVIEHISNVSGFIDNITKFLKPGGALILTTPNKDYLPIGCVWFSDVPPVHTCIIGSQFFKLYAKDNGLSLSVFNYNVNIRNKNILLTLSLDKIGMILNRKANLTKQRIDFNNLVKSEENTIKIKMRKLFNNNILCAFSRIIMKYFLFRMSSQTLGVILKKK